MKKFNQADFNHFVISNRVVGFFDNAVTLKSGRKSHWYVNWRTVSNDAFLLDQLSDFLLAFSKDMNFNSDAFYGVPEGATKLGVISSYKLAKGSKDFGQGKFVVPMGRAKPKEHGVPADRFFVGEPKGRVVVVEDVTTTGGSLISELKKLSEAKVNVVAAVGLTNRMELNDDGKPVAKVISEMGFSYYSLSSADEILPLAYKSLKPAKEIAKEIEKEFAEYGAVKIVIPA